MDSDNEDEIRAVADSTLCKARSRFFGANAILCCYIYAMVAFECTYFETQTYCT